MQQANPSNARLAVCGAAIFTCIALSPAAAAILFESGNHQYTNVNMVAASNVWSIVGNIGNTGLQMSFADMIGPDGLTQVRMHNRGAALDSQHDFLTNPDTGFYSLSLRPQSGYGFSAGDFSLDVLNRLGNGLVKFTGIDQFNVATSATFSINAKGQNTYNFHTSGGDLLSNLIISGSPYTKGERLLLQDLKQVSVHMSPIPEPETLALFGIGLVGLLLNQRRKPRPIVR